MAEIPYSQFDVAIALQAGDALRIQRRIGGIWRDYQLPLDLQAKTFVQTYSVATLIANNDQLLGSAAPSGKGYIPLPESWIRYEPGPGHADDNLTFTIFDDGASDQVYSSSLLLRLGNSVYSTFGSNTNSIPVRDTANAGQLRFNGPFTAGDGTITVSVSYFLVDI